MNKLKHVILATGLLGLLFFIGGGLRADDDNKHHTHIFLYSTGVVDSNKCLDRLESSLRNDRKLEVEQVLIEGTNIVFRLKVWPHNISDGVELLLNPDLKCEDL